MTDDEQQTIDERAAIMEYDGGLPRAKAEEQAKAAFRTYRYRLIGGNGWATLIAPGWTLEDAEKDLRGRYEELLVEVVEHKAC